MKIKLGTFVKAPEVISATQAGKPVVALESALLTHGLPYPENVETTLAMAEAVRDGGAVPAVVALAEGSIHVGASDELIEQLGQPEKTDPLKVNPANLAVALATKRFGGTTVATTLQIAAATGIKVFATGGIGGVHHPHPGGENMRDVSADLPALQRHQCIVVSAGAKVLLDLEATREELETRGVPTLGWQTDRLPEFICPPGSIWCDARIDDLQVLCSTARYHWALEGGALLFTVPCPPDVAVEKSKITAWLDELESRMPGEVRGTRDATPWMLSELAGISNNESKTANKALLINNASVAANVAVELAKV